MKTLYRRKKFDKDVKLMQKRGAKIAKLWDVVEKLINGKPLEAKHRNHKLSGDWLNHWDLHIEPDWLLIYQANEIEIILVRTGTHSDLF